MTTFHHRHALNYSFYAGSVLVKFSGGHLRTENPEVIKAIKNSRLFGNKEDGAVIYEVEKLQKHMVEEHRLVNSTVALNTPPPAFRPMSFQPLYAVDGWHQCSICGLKLGNQGSLVEHIKQVHGEKKFAALDLKKEPPVVRPFVIGSGTAPAETETLPLESAKK